MMPPIAVVVPMVALFSMLRLSDTYFGLILAYTAFTLPFSHLDDPLASSRRFRLNSRARR